MHLPLLPYASVRPWLASTPRTLEVRHQSKAGGACRHLSPMWSYSYRAAEFHPALQALRGFCYTGCRGWKIQGHLRGRRIYYTALAEHRRIAPHVETLLRASQKNAYPLFGASLLTYLRQTKGHWLAFVTPLLCAAGFFPCTQFACCPDG